MTPEKLQERIDKILAVQHDPEAAHSYEDDLHLELIAEFCPEWVASKIRELSDAPFARWCA